MLHYACTLRDMVQKMGWRKLSLVMSADYEGKVLADAMLEYSKKEKWNILQTVWITRSENTTVLRSTIKLTMTNESDVVIVHVRDKHNEDLFRLVQSLGVNQFKALWVLTDITTYGVSDSTVLPRGLVSICPWKSLEHDFMENALYDAFDLIAMSVKDAARQTSREDLQGLIKRLVYPFFFRVCEAIVFEQPPTIL